MRWRMNATISLAAAGALASAVVIGPSSRGDTKAEGPAAIAPVLTCAQLAGLSIAGSTAVIEKAEARPEAPAGTVQVRPPLPETVGVAIPANCRAEGVIDKRIGIDGTPYAIGFAIALPDRWNGRFLFQGGGGLNGTIRPPLGPQATGDVPALARGFAVVSTDSGHKGAEFDPSFRKDQEASLNFAQASVGKVTAAAKAIIARYYGQPAKHSYFVGCSTGGREGMLASERYPEAFDGIVAGDPAMRTGRSNLGLAWANASFNEIAPRGDDGKPDPTKVFSAADRKLVTNAILDACDAKDGLKDGMIFSTQQCHFDPASLTCRGVKTDSCLSAPQVGALTKAFAGPKNSRGAQSYPPFPWDSGIGAEGVRIPGILTTGARSPVEPPFHENINVDEIEDKVDADGMERLTNTWYWTNLTSFFAHGGKILYYHGWSDPWFSPLDTLEYYERMAKDSGGFDQVRASSSRAYFVPGMGHCTSGATLDHFDFLGAVVDWVEHGKAPDAVIATGLAFPGRSRPLCAYPQHAQYKGAGNPEDAASFECRD
ncbi:MAG TPA: tannase/feruloyl esterase family alpha/beta hydrolase [Alphaproteobacteria bacterium]|nr:tannase/feruloyl esterase family alpha/beta hydrolase [Alphaproteobacteria bacterium]